MSSPYPHQDLTTLILKKPKTFTKEEQKDYESRKAAYNKVMRENTNDIEPPKKTNNDIRNFIKKARCLRHMSQTEIANKLNVQSKLVTNWENGKEPIPGYIISKLNTILNVNIKKSIIN